MSLYSSRYIFSENRIATRYNEIGLPSASLFCLIPVPIWLLAAALSSELLASFGAIVGLCLGSLWIRALFRQTSLMLGFLKIGAVCLLLIMSLSWLMAQFFSLTALGQNLSEVLVRDVGTSLPAYAVAVACALVFAAMLGKLGTLQFINALEAIFVVKLRAARQVRLRNLLALILIISFVDIYLTITGVISYRGFANEGYEVGNIPWFMPLFQTMFATQVILNALAFCQMTNATTTTKFSWALLALSFILNLFVNFTQGRSLFVFCVLLHFFWFVFFFEKTPAFKKLFFLFLLFLPVLYTGVLLNNFMRGSEVNKADVKTIGIVQFLINSLEVYQKIELLRQVEKKGSAVNLATRPLVAHPLAKAIELPDNRKKFLLGENLINSFIWALPSPIMPNKKNYLILEDLFYQAFPFGVDDSSDSPYFYAYADFGYAGILIYPMLLACIWSVVLLLVNLSYVTSLGALVYASIWISMFTLFLGEATMLAYFVLLRDTIFTLPLVILLSKLFKFPRGGKQLCVSVTTS